MDWEDPPAPRLNPNSDETLRKFATLLGSATAQSTTT